MFGTVAKMTLKPGSMEKMRSLREQQQARGVKGFRFSAVFQSKSDPNETWLVVGFDDEASYRANAEDPETNKMAEQMRVLMAAPSEWHDGEIVNMRTSDEGTHTG